MGVEEAGFAHVGLAAEGDPQAGLEDAPGALVTGGIEHVRQLERLGDEVGGGLGLVDLLRVVDAGGHPGLERVKLVRSLANKGGGTALQLTHGGPAAAFAPGGDQAHHSLGLRKVDAAVEERPAGEFARLGQACAFCKAQGQHPLGEVRTAVQVDFCHVLPGVGAGRAHQHGHALVDDLALFHGMAVGQQMAGEGQGAFARRAEHPQQDAFRLRAAQADNGDAALSGCGGDGGNGVGDHHSVASSCFQYSADGSGSAQG